jgi:hypothetical protein
MQPKIVTPVDKNNQLLNPAGGEAAKVCPHSDQKTHPWILVLIAALNCGTIPLHHSVHIRPLERTCQSSILHNGRYGDGNDHVKAASFSCGVTISW